jgi:6-pyruvoyltetrahydropterin/6-carboxytetrahydropterin synthase
MLELSRTVRFCVNDPPANADKPSHNTFAARPPMQGLGRYYELDVTCRGHADPHTGYFINIKHIDHAVHQHALPHIHQTLFANNQPTQHQTKPPTHNTKHSGADIPLGQLMRQMINHLQTPLQQSVTLLVLRLTPTHSIALRNADMDHVLIRQRYEFSAAHRLHVPTLSDHENREVFGKCNNPAGHGHNYRLEVAVRLPIDTHGHTADVAHIDAIVNQHAIQPLDHKHLNTDVPQFANLNPSVENIVKVIWDMLDDRFNTLDPDASLDELRVWETSKTVCTYRGPTPHQTP